ncbi:MAG: lysophospholipase [Myxococcota bacterium]
MSTPLRRYELSVQGIAARSLYRRGWLPRAPRAAVLLAHGLAEHSGRYEHVGTWLAERGIAVHALDHVGHGRSSGPRCHVDRFEMFLDDYGFVLDALRKESPELPFFLLGHSMGGLIVSAFVCERGPEVSGVALSGPPLAIAEGALRRKMSFARLLRMVAPKLRIAAGLPEDGLATDPAVREAYDADPLVEHKLTVSLACELGAWVEHTHDRGAEVTAPLLIQHGADDPICDVRGGQAFAKAAPRGGHRSYAGLRHEIFNEPSYQEVLSDLLEWIEGRLQGEPVSS